MPTIKGWKCDICKHEFSTEALAENCEQSHADLPKRLKIIAAYGMHSNHVTPSGDQIAFSLHVQQNGELYEYMLNTGNKEYNPSMTETSIRKQQLAAL